MKLDVWMNASVQHFPNAIVAIVILVSTVFISRVSARWVLRGLARTTMSEQLVGLVEGLFRAGVVTLGVVLALNAMNLDRAVATALAGVGVVGLALGFAFQDVAANLISGVFMAIKQPFAVDEVIETNGYTGAVERLGLRATEIRQFTGELVLIPNRKIFSEALINFSAATQRRVDLTVGVSYGDDLDEAERVALEAVSTVEWIDHSREPMVLFRDFGSSSVDFEVRFWVPYRDDRITYLRSRSDAIKAIHRAFRRAGITIPFPIRTLDVPEAGRRAVRDAAEAVASEPDS